MALLRRVLLAAIMLVLVFTIFNIRTIFQEGNPLPVLWAIIKLEFTDSNIVAFAENKFIQKDGPETPLTDFLAEHAWEFKDRLGSVIFYTRGDHELFVKTRSFTGFYNVYELEYSLIDIKAFLRSLLYNNVIR